MVISSEQTVVHCCKLAKLTTWSCARSKKLAGLKVFGEKEEEKEMGEVEMVEKVEGREAKQDHL